MPELISVYSKATGRKREIPVEWLDNERLMAPFEKTPLQRQADAAGDLKGKALAKALQDAGLPEVGTADDKRAALQAYRTEQAALEVIAANDDLHPHEDDDGQPDVDPRPVDNDGQPVDDVDPTDPLTTTTDTPRAGDTEGA